MTKIGWPLLELASRLLEADEREAVLGDLAEAEETVWKGLRGVVGLIVRRQMALWRTWEPWLAGVGLALPCGYLLPHVSISVSCTYERLAFHKIYNQYYPTGHEGYLLLLCHILLLIAWSWTAGYVMGTVSRQTVAVSTAVSMLPPAMFLERCFFLDLPSGWMFLFVLPAIWGVHHGLRKARIPFRTACMAASTITALMFLAWENKALWIYNWVLVWPAWYLVVKARKCGQSEQTGSP